VLDSIPPIMLAFVRFIVALVLLLTLLGWRGLRPVWGWDAAVLGFSGVTVLFAVQNYGLSLASATDASLIMGGGVPVLTSAIAWRVLDERLSGRALAGLVASVIGVVLVVFVAAHGLGSSLVGDLLLVGSATSAAVYVVAGRRAFARHGLLPLLAGSAGWGVLMLAPLVAVEAVVTGARMPSATDALALLYLGACCSFGAYLLWGYSLRALTASETAIISNLEVVIGVAAAGIALGEPIAASQGAGAALVVAGAWLATVQPASGGTSRWHFGWSVERVGRLKQRRGVL
jgi:drug/metabolite transporter (DMT)-like permease